MAKLTYTKRQRLHAKSFGIPKERRYPIHDISHARAALARVSQHGSRKEQEQVQRAVYRKYPSLKK